MNRKHFFTFLLSLIPGAGQMYLGSMKKGLCIMMLFGSIYTLCNLFPIHLIDFLLPVIGFYAFFDTLTLRHLNEQERKMDEEAFLYQVKNFLSQDWSAFFSKHRIVVGTLIIILGIYTLFNDLVRPILYDLGNYLGWSHNFMYNLPTLLLSSILVTGGFYLIIHFTSNET